EPDWVLERLSITLEKELKKRHDEERRKRGDKADGVTEKAPSSSGSSKTLEQQEKAFGQESLLSIRKMALNISTTMLTTTAKPSSSIHAITLCPHPTNTLLTACSPTTLYPTASLTIPPSQDTILLAAREAITLYPTASLTFPPSQDQLNHPPGSSPHPSPSSSSSDSIQPTAFWAILASLGGLLFILLSTVLLWYLYCYRPRRHLAQNHTPPPSISITPPSTTSSGSLPPSQQQQQQQPPWWAPLSQQQYDLLQAIGAAHSIPSQLQPHPPLPLPQLQPPPPSYEKKPFSAHDYGYHHNPRQQQPLDPNTSTLLSRLRQLNNPSILGAVPESTVLTASSLHPEMGRGQVNASWKGLAEKRAAAGGYGDQGDGGGEEGGEGGEEKGGGKRVRWREREWAVLGSDVESGVGGEEEGGGGGGGGK
ncbi:MAG: hypothetical protein Q9184_007588, partial [Pyrenodesmia sp. 2 TL-2023]